LTTASDPRAPTAWLLQDGEPLPVDDHPRLMRTGDLANRLVAAGFRVTWWTSRFNHNLKRFREQPGTWCQNGTGGVAIALLDGPGYARNLSWQRIRHYRALAAHFAAEAAKQPRPDVILGSYPSPELCDAGREYAQRHGVPFVLDIRDPWPDIFDDYLPVGTRWLLAPVLRYYRRKIRSVSRGADSIVAVSRAMLDWGIHYAGRHERMTDKVFYIGFRHPARSRTIPAARPFTIEDPLVCLFATTCGRSYHGEMVIDAARLLEQSGERRIRFVITGDGEMRAQWMARAAGLESVTFTGWISHEELQRHFERSHVGLVLMKGGITRFWLGNKIFEYLASYLAVANDVPGEAADLVEGEDAGFNVPPGDAAALAHELRSLVNDPVRVHRHMEKARRAFQQKFDRDSIQSSYVEHLQELMHRKLPAGATAA
jgi:glycosyltransferase involved in cell wall biosynthesis